MFNDVKKGDRMDKKEIIRKIIERIHRGEDPEKIKEEFREMLGDISPLEIAKVEEELIKEGMSREEIMSLCDIHMEVFRESLNKVKLSLEEWHPLKILLREHSAILGLAGKFRDSVKKLKEEGFSPDDNTTLKEMTKFMDDSKSHYLREENVLFPYIEKHGITQPPAIMWSEHDNIRGIEKEILSILEQPLSNESMKKLDELSLSLFETLSNHFYKESNILFPAALRVIEDNEWIEIRKEFDELGYVKFIQGVPNLPETLLKRKERDKKMEGMIDLDTGELNQKEMRAILDTLPIDITFVDREDKVRYFNKSKERIFPRTKAVIGRKVQMCHPQKSLHVVNKILQDFREGKRDVAEFWINLDGRVIYIRYFAVRDESGEYLGTLEVTQDITDIKKIEGEKRLLDD